MLEALYRRTRAQTHPVESIGSRCVPRPQPHLSGIRTNILKMRTTMADSSCLLFSLRALLHTLAVLRRFYIKTMRQTKKTFQAGAHDVKSYRFTEPVVRVAGQKARGKSAPRGTTKLCQTPDPQRRITVFHKRKDKNEDADVVGTRNVTAWKKSSGRSKSWKSCKRFKITPGFLELLISCSGHPVSFGWQFSTLKTPASFVKGHRVHVNKEPKSRRTKNSTANSAIKGLFEDDLWVLPSPRRRLQSGQAVRRPLGRKVAPSEMPKRFLRIFLGSNTFIKTEEESPTSLSLATSPCRAEKRVEQQSNVCLQRFAVVDMVCSDNQADIYSVRDLGHPSVLYHAHVFLSQGFGNNWLKYRQRKIDRMRRSKDFHAETVQFGKQILVMRVDSEAEHGFQMKNTQQEFPPLPRIGESPCSVSCARQMTWAILMFLL